MGRPGGRGPTLRSTARLSRAGHRVARPTWSAPALLAGLPTDGHGLTPELFVRAAAVPGLTAQSGGPASLPTFRRLVLPAVLLQHGRHACVLVRRSLDRHASN